MSSALLAFGPDFSALPPVALWLLVGVSLALLCFGGDRAVTGAAHLAETLGVSKVIIGATIVSLGTTSAEFFVSVMAAFRGQGDLALGNAVGSIIVDTALIFALGCLVRTLPKDRFLLHRQGVVKLSADTLLTATLFLLAARHGGWKGVVVPRWVGMAYVLLLAGYLVLSVRWARHKPKLAQAGMEVLAHGAVGVARPAERWRRVPAHLGVMAVGLAAVILGSEIMIKSVTSLSLRYGIPQHILAVTLVAFGTSLPELVTAIASLVKGHPELLIGNVIGADILNVLFVTGFAAAAVPLAVSPSFYYLHVPVMWGSTLLLGLYIFTGGATFRRWQGLPLLALYVGYCLLLAYTRGQV